MSLYVAKIPNSESSYEIGKFSVVDGYYGPAPRNVIEQFRLIEGAAQVQKTLPIRELLLLSGTIKPKKSEDFEYLAEAIERLEKIVSESPVERPTSTFKPRYPDKEEEEIEEEVVDEAPEIPLVPYEKLPGNAYNKAQQIMRDAGFDIKAAIGLASDEKAYFNGDQVKAAWAKFLVEMKKEKSRFLPA